MRGLQKRRTCLSWQQPPTPRMWWLGQCEVCTWKYQSCPQACPPPLWKYQSCTPPSCLVPPPLWKYQSCPQVRPPSTMEISILPPGSTPLYYGNINYTPSLVPPPLWKYQSCTPPSCLVPPPLWKYQSCPLPPLEMSCKICQDHARLKTFKTSNLARS